MKKYDELQAQFDSAQEISIPIVTFIRKILNIFKQMKTLINSEQLKEVSPCTKPTTSR